MRSIIAITAITAVMLLALMSTSCSNRASDSSASSSVSSTMTPEQQMEALRSSGSPAAQQERLRKDLERRQSGIQTSPGNNAGPSGLNQIDTRRGFWTNTRSTTINNDLLSEPNALAVVGILLTLVTAGITLFKND